MRKLISLVFIPFFIVIQGCQKAERPAPDTSTTNKKPISFSITEAMKWFNQHGRDLPAQTALKQTTLLKSFTPQWNKASSGEDKEFYVIEVPLHFEKSPGFIIQHGSENRPEQNINGKTSLLILKHKQTHMIRSVLMHVISTTAGDIHFTYLSRGENFSGDIFFTGIDGRFINGWVYEKGKVVAASRNEVYENEQARAYLPENCETREIKWYERTCIFYDDNSIECSTWQYVGSTYQTYCTEEGSGGVGGSDGCDVPSAGEVLAQGGTISESVSSISGSPTTSSTGEITKEWNGSWYFYRGNWLNYTWRYISYEKGVHKKVNNVWKWKSLTHVGHAQVGVAPFKTTCTMIRTLPTIYAEETVARMDLDFEVKMCIECKGINFGCGSDVSFNWKTWVIAPDGTVS